MPQWTSGSGRGYAGAESDGVIGYASGAGFGVVFTGGKPCRTEKNFNLGADLSSVVRKLIRSSKVVTPVRCDVDIKLEIWIFYAYEKHYCNFSKLSKAWRSLCRWQMYWNCAMGSSSFNTQWWSFIE